MVTSVPIYKIKNKKTSAVVLRSEMQTVRPRIPHQRYHAVVII
jgi:hypothetical protein